MRAPLIESIGRDVGWLKLWDVALEREGVETYAGTAGSHSCVCLGTMAEVAGVVQLADLDGTPLWCHLRDEHLELRLDDSILDRIKKLIVIEWKLILNIKLVG